MPELPDIFVLARSMDKALRGRAIMGVEVYQPKCLNHQEVFVGPKLHRRHRQRLYPGYPLVRAAASTACGEHPGPG